MLSISTCLILNCYFFSVTHLPQIAGWIDSFCVPCIFKIYKHFKIVKKYSINSILARQTIILSNCLWVVEICKYLPIKMLTSISCNKHIRIIQDTAFHKRVIASVVGKWNIYFFPRSGNKAKCGVEFRHSTITTTRKPRKFGSLKRLSAVVGIEVS